jgi:hypothetical protein
MSSLFGWRRVSVCVAMSQMRHPTAGEVQAGNDSDRNDGDDSEYLDPTGHAVGRSARRFRVSYSFGDRMCGQLHSSRCKIGHGVR